MSTTRRSPRAHRLAVLLAMVLPLMSLSGGFSLAPAHAVDPPPFSVTITHTGGTATATTTGKMLGTCTTIPAAEATDPCVYLEVPASGTPTLYLGYIGSLRISRIQANGDLKISVGGGANNIDNVSNKPAINAGTSSLTIVSSVAGEVGAKLSITGNISAGSFTVGETSGNKVTVTVGEGAIPGDMTPVVNTPSVLNGWSERPPGQPEPCVNSSISIGEFLVVENCLIKDPLPGVLVDKVLIEGPELWAPSFFITLKDQVEVGPIVVSTAEGGTAPGLTIQMEGTSARIAPNTGGYSINAPASSVGFTGRVGTQQVFELAGGIRASDVSAGDWSTLQIGSSAYQSERGIEVTGAVEADRSVIDIWTGNGELNDIAIQVPSPAAWGDNDDRNAPDGYAIRATNEGEINVRESTTAISATGAKAPRILVSHGGSISLKGTTLGTFEEYVSYWPVAEAAAGECLEPTDPPSQMAKTEPLGDGNTTAWERVPNPYRLTSTGKPLQNLQWALTGNFADIANGSACIKSAVGYSQVAQDFESLDSDAKFVDYWIQEGTPVEVKLLPDYKYQFVSGEFTTKDGAPVTLTAATLEGPAAMYQFVMPGSYIELDAVFKYQVDYVAPDPAVESAVAGGTIDVSKAGFTVDSGNARVTVADPISENNFVADVPTGFDDGTLTYMDLGIDSIILAGNEETGWESPVKLGATPTVEITLQLGSDLKGYTGYTVLHDTGKTVEELPVTNYNTATGEITFSTSSFSTFAIVHTGVRLPSGGGGGGGTTADAPIAGADRFGTAAAVSQEAFPYPGVPVVYVTSGLKYPDALAASAAAVHQGGPVLLVTADGIPATTADELTRLKPGSIVVLGGPAAVSDAVVTALQSYTAGSVTRVAGADRYATAIQAAQAFTATGGSVVLATGADFPDALSAGTLLSSYPGPVLLVKPGEGLSAGVKAELVRLAPARVFVLGGTSAVSAQAADDAGALSPQVIRLAGANRYATSAAIATWVIANSGITGGVLGTTGTNFPDGLTAGVLTAHLNGAIVLANGTCWSADAVTLFNRMGASTARLIGGNAVMAPSLATLTSCTP